MNLHLTGLDSTKIHRHFLPQGQILGPGVRSGVTILSFLWLQNLCSQVFFFQLQMLFPEEVQVP